MPLAMNVSLSRVARGFRGGLELLNLTPKLVELLPQVLILVPQLLDRRRFWGTLLSLAAVTALLRRCSSRTTECRATSRASNILCCASSICCRSRATQTTGTSSRATAAVKSRSDRNVNCHLQRIGRSIA